MSKDLWIAQNLLPGEQYAGILLGADGAQDHHLILLAPAAGLITWDAAIKWAQKVGGSLPTRKEQALLFANLPAAFECAWYWSDAQYAGDESYAWAQAFGYGRQGSYLKDVKLRARAVRRLTIQ